MQIDFNEKEINIMIGILDIALRSKGLAVRESINLMMVKLQNPTKES